MNWYLKLLKEKYKRFDGRVGRQEFWKFCLIEGVIVVLLSLLDYALGTFRTDLRMGLLGGLYILGVLVPSVAMAVGRLHDTGRSGWWLLAALVPVAGPAVIWYFYLKDGQAGANRYGPDPQAAVA